MKLYSIKINLKTQKIEEDVCQVRKPYFGVDYMTEGDAFPDGHVTYNTDGWEDVYVEASSRELAITSLKKFCLDMSENFRKVNEIL